MLRIFQIIFVIFSLLVCTLGQANIPPTIPYDDINPTTITYGMPCDGNVYNRYLEQVKDARLKKNWTAFETLGDDYYPSPGGGQPNGKIFDKVGEICISVTRGKIVDMNWFSCSRRKDMGICTCGHEMNRWDDFTPGAKPLPISIGRNVLEQTYLGLKYNADYGFNRRLVLQNGKCVSGRDGHCTTKGNVARRKGYEIMTCQAGFICKDFNDTNSPVKITNSITGESYGVCKRGSADDSKGGSDPNVNISWIFIFAAVFMIFNRFVP